MRVGLVTKKNTFEVLEMPEPTADAGKAVVDISHCGICGTDLHAYLSGEPYNPAICGHEWAGTVSALGADVTGVKEGDRVAIGVTAACGRCESCLRGDSSHCQVVFAGAIGVGPLASPHGGFAERLAFEARRLYKVDRAVSDAHAAILEPATVAVHAIRRTPIQLGDSVVIIGGGPIGLLVLQAAMASGAGIALLVEPQPTRRALAASLGAHTIDPTAEEVADAIRNIIGKEGADVVFECAGIHQTIQHAVDYVRRGGFVSLVGVPALPAQINAAGWLVKEVRLTASIAYNREDFEIAQGLVVDGRIQCAPIHTQTVGLDAAAAMFARLSDAPEEIKVLVDPRI